MLNSKKGGVSKQTARGRNRVSRTTKKQISLKTKPKSPVDELRNLRRFGKSASDSYHQFLYRTLAEIYRHFLKIETSKALWRGFVAEAKKTKTIKYDVKSSASALRRLTVVVRYVVQTGQSYNRQNKYAHVLANFHTQGVRPDTVLMKLQELGVETLYEGEAAEEREDHVTHLAEDRGNSAVAEDQSGDVKANHEPVLAISQDEEVMLPKGCRDDTKPDANVFAITGHSGKPKWPSKVTCTPGRVALLLEVSPPNAEYLFSREDSVYVFQVRISASENGGWKRFEYLGEVEAKAYGDWNR